MQRMVWTILQGDVKIFSEDSSGNKVDYLTGDHTGEEPDPIFTYCYLEGVQISIGTEVKRRAVTGRGRRKLINQSGVFDEITIEVEHMFFRKSTEFNIADVFNPTKQLRLEFNLDELTYSGNTPFENDSFGFSFCRTKSFKLTGSNGDVMKATASFVAELVV